MGGLIIYELSHYFEQKGFRPPVHLFCSGTKAPHVQEKYKAIHQISDDEFLTEINNLGGTPKNFFKQKELIALYLPILRNDFQVIETYQFTPKSTKLKSDLSILYGSKELIKDSIQEWRIHTSGNCNFYEFTGSHFFLENHVQAIANLLNMTLKDYLIKEENLT
jgi:surfactin synthase thioesterase subunit